MFSYIKLENYKSLTNFHVDLRGKRGIPKKFILVYGENGVGKSNFAYAFYTLYETLRTKSIKEIVENLREKSDEYKDNLSFQKFLLGNFKDVEAIIKDCKTIDSSGNMVLEFGFRIKGKNGIYRLELDNRKIVAERLEYVINKNKTILFDINEERIKLNENVFKKQEYAVEVRDLLEKYWGKHSLLSIMICEIEEKKDGYVKNRICKGLYEIISYFMLLSIRVKTGNRMEIGKMGMSHKILGNLEQGTIALENEAELDKAEAFINEFFTSLYSDVKRTFYKKTVENQEIKYRLYFKKLISGRLMDIDFEKESTGTQCLLELLPFFISGVEGRTVILDEMDTGIHDLLVDNILRDLYDSTQGQIIITTHNTMLLESELPKECIYIFRVDKDANKELLPLNEIEEHLHPNLNIRKRYLNGLYGGIPVSMEIDFDELSEIME